MTHSLLEFAPSLPAWLAQTIVVLGAGLLATALGLLVHHVLYRLLAGIARASESPSDDMLMARLARPTRYAMVALFLVLFAREIPALGNFWTKIAGFVMPALVGWVVISVLHALVHAMELRNDISVADNLKARQRRTRLTIFSRIATFLIVFATVGLMLLSIPGVRDVGVTLMASAGLAALAVGAAAQPALKALIAGLQMALTEPIRIDDVVIIDGEWGWIEDIRTTFVVVRTWDRRRLIVPTTKFLEQTFENWTKTGSQVIGAVHLHLDPTTDFAAMRTHFEELVRAHPKWDGDVQNLQVTGASAEAVEVRMLMTAKDSPTVWELRCEIREAMLLWLRENQPQAFARRRIAAAGLPDDQAGAGA